MVGLEFKNIVQNFNPKSPEHYQILEQLTQDYPYFPTPWMYLAKAAQAQKKIDTERIFERAAILSCNRAAFKDWMEESNIPEPQDSKETARVEESESLTEEKPAAVKVLKPKSPPKKTKAKPSTKKNTAAKSDIESRSFLDWLDHTNEDEKTPIKEPSETQDKWEIIDAFIDTNPKISTPDKKASEEKSVDFAAQQQFVEEELMTETLAKILVKQNKYTKALQAYKILSLKYPEKNSFFANQIDQIKRLQQDKQ